MHLGIVGLVGSASCGRPKRIPTDYPAGLDQCYIHTFSIAGAQKRVIVYYAEIPEVDTTPRDGINDWAVKLGRWTAAAWTAFTDYGFSSPARSTDDRGIEEVEVWIYPRGGIGLCCTAQGILVPAESVNEREEVHEVVIHELFHATQADHLPGSGYPAWFIEGTAQVMQDHTDAAIDTRPNGLTSGSSVGSGCADIYLATPQEDITTRPNECAVALWWKYFMEQLGRDMREPQGGVDALVGFFDFLTSSERFLEKLDEFIRDRSRGSRDMESIWCDFTVANYVKNLSGSSVPSKYRYRDEAQPPGSYDFDDDPDTPPVVQDLNRTLDSGRSFDGSVTDVLPWSARYYRVRPVREVSAVQVDFRQDTDQRVCYTLLVIDRDDLVQVVPEVRRDFSKTIPNREYDEIVVIVTTFSDAVNYRYSIKGTR